MSNSILIIDDDDRFRQKLAEAFMKRGYAATTAANAQEALDCAAESRPAKIVLDLRLGLEFALPLIPQLVALLPQVRIVVLTGYGSISTALEAVRLGAWHYLTKPAGMASIVAAFEDSRGSNQAPVKDETPTLSRVEWEHIQRVIQDCNGNISHAAKVLGIHRRSLQRKLSKQPL